MKQIPAGECKVQCLAIMDQVLHSGEPGLITKPGKPAVRLGPAEKQGDEIFGYMAGKVKIAGDIAGRITPLEDWAVRREPRFPLSPA
jgi:antitoxin (DNA-binding transcriptional repressor) of toxin-antitoxin stability system